MWVHAHCPLGEDLTDTYIISRTRVELLQVPRLMFLKTHHSGVLQEMCANLNSALPNNQQIFRLYFEESNWSNYKHSVVQEVIRKRAVPHTTSLLDVPYAIREDSWRIGQHFMDRNVLQPPKYTYQ